MRTELADSFPWQKNLTRSITILILLALSIVAATASNESGVYKNNITEEYGLIVAGVQNAKLNYNYEKVDSYAINTPASAETSIQNLSAYLAKPGWNEREKARAIFRWIAENIDYNVEGLFNESNGNLFSKDLLKSRKSVCDGYSDIFQSLATEAGLESARISGYGKGYGYQPGKKINESNHAWNSVKINGSWYLIDCTWGAGYVDEDKKYVRKFDSHFFMTPPAEFVFDHFPDDPIWQLLSNPISKDQFERSVYTKSEFFKYNMELGNHTEGEIKCDKDINISVYAPKDVLLIAALDYADRDQSHAGISLIDYIFWEREIKRYDIYARFPDEGKYILKVYAKLKDEPGEYHEALEYKIEAKPDRKESLKFPMRYSKFADMQSYLYSPMDGEMKSGTNYRFKIKVPNANNVSVICGKEWSYLKLERGLFEGNVTPKKGDVLVCGNFNGTNWDGLLKYTAQ